METENYNSMMVYPAEGENPRRLYEHQIEAMKKLDAVNKKDTFHSLLVLPTGGGKTLTAVYWLLKNAVDKGKKVLWVAHRHLLLEQAAEAFWKNAYTGQMINHTAFRYRIISGIHDKPVHIQKADNILIVGKDSVIRSLSRFDEWMKNEDVFFVIDEAHHAAAKSYKKIISYVEEHAKTVKLLGLTATPFRTSEDEQGALKQIFSDDIVYKTDLETLIKRQILATPICIEHKTNMLMGQSMGLNAVKSIEFFDKIPEDIANEIADKKERNRLIVDRYFENIEKYGPTVVFALNKAHALALNALFNERGKQYGYRQISDFIISDVRDSATGITVSGKENEAKIKKYRDGEIQVLINVNILTEGTDLPKTQTVFLTRPTVSKILMTQMVGRALRGVRAGGTKEAYIVSFIDDWNDKIAWVSPEILAAEEYTEQESEYQKREYAVRLISISKIEEFALIADETVDSGRLEAIPAIERIPLGLYTFSFMETGGNESMEHFHQILVYDSTKKAYEEMISDLPGLFEEYGIEDESIPEDKLSLMAEACREGYFDDNMIPAYNQKDIESLLMFYAQKEKKPLFVSMDELDRGKLDLSAVAKEIIDKDMRQSEEDRYVSSLWEEGGILPIYYSNFYFFNRMLQVEKDKIKGHIPTASGEPESEAEMRAIEKFSLQEMIERYPKYGLDLKERVFEANKDADGYYTCRQCGCRSKTRISMQIDHIKPMSQGGLTVFENLQVLCRDCNMKKRDSYAQG